VPLSYFRREEGPAKAGFEIDRTLLKSIPFACLFMSGSVYTPPFFLPIVAASRGFESSSVIHRTCGRQRRCSHCQQSLHSPALSGRHVILRPKPIHRPVFTSRRNLGPSPPAMLCGNTRRTQIPRNPIITAARNWPRNTRSPSRNFSHCTPGLPGIVQISGQAQSTALPVVNLCLYIGRVVVIVQELVLCIQASY